MKTETNKTSVTEEALMAWIQNNDTEAIEQSNIDRDLEKIDNVFDGASPLVGDVIYIHKTPNCVSSSIHIEYYNPKYDITKHISLANSDKAWSYLKDLSEAKTLAGTQAFDVFVQEWNFVNCKTGKQTIYNEYMEDEPVEITVPFADSFAANAREFCNRKEVA